MAPAMRSRRTSSFAWNSDSLREPLSQWPTDLESSNETSADDFSDVDERNFRGSRYESDLSDVGESRQDRRRFRDSSLMKVNYDSDSCLTPRSRRTLRRTLSSSTEPWPSAKPPSKAPALDTIFSPTHEILHPLQSLRLERSLSSKELFPTEVYRTSVTFSTFKLPKPLECIESSPKPKETPGKFDSYTYDSHKLPKLQSSTVEEEKLEQKQSLIDSVESASLSTVNEEKSEMEILTPNVVVIVVDAEKKLTFVALDWAINVVVRPGDEIIILGVLKHISSPMGYKMVANTDPLYGVNREFLQSEVEKTTESFQSKVSESGRREECEKKKVKPLPCPVSAHDHLTKCYATSRFACSDCCSRDQMVAVQAYRADRSRCSRQSSRCAGAASPGCDVCDFRQESDEESKILRQASVMPRRAHAEKRTFHKSITQLVPSTKARSTTSDISSVSSSMSTDRTSSNETSRSPPFWRRITSFRSSRRTIPRSSPGSTHRSDITSPPVSEVQQNFQEDLNQLKSVEAPADAYSYKGMRSRRKHLAAISVTIPPAICAN